MSKKSAAFSYPAAPILTTVNRERTADEPGRENIKDVEKPSTEDWSTMNTPMNTHWRSAVPRMKKVLDEQGIQGLRSALDVEPRTRWVNELLPQIKRALSLGKTEAILVLGFCPLCDNPGINLDRPSCRTLKVVSALEMPDGPPVLMLDARKDCIRHTVLDPDGTEHKQYCLRFLRTEFEATLEHLVFELYLIIKIFKFKISSVLAFSEC